MLIFDFSGIYENEGYDFFEKDPRSIFKGSTKRDILISFKDISGTNCICDDYAKENIKKRIKDAIESIEDVKRCTDNGGCGVESSFRSLPGIRFLDSGNYHYMSRILMDLIMKDREFDLVLFDHHPDMKWTSYGEILSCGSWILNALNDCENLRNVYAIGVDHELSQEIMNEHLELKDRVFFYDHIEELSFDEMDKGIYISIDKDVLSSDEIETNWDQGEMTVGELKESLELLRDRFGGDILAVDVCGECAPDSEYLFTEYGIEASNMINLMISAIFENVC